MSQLLSENCIVFDIDADEKREVLMTLVTELYRAGRVTDIGKFYEDVLAREAIAPTFVGFDMGLPHGKTDNVLEASVCFGRTTRPVVWNEGSGETADLVILIAVPVLYWRGEEMNMKEQLKTLKKHILTGTSHMIPFIVAGGILFSLAVMLNPAGAATPTEGWLAGLAQIGLAGLTLFVPVLGGYIAYSIADKPGLAPGMLGAYLANSMGAGFLGGIGAPIAVIMQSLTSWLSSLGDVGKVPLASILGAMTAFDMGGPINKVATLFAQTQVDTLPYLMGGVGVAICTPPIGMGIATLLAPKKYNPEEKEAGKAAILKESLLSEYQLNVKLPKPCVLVNPILQAEDRAKIEKLDIPRKTILSSYYTIEEKLGFLDEKTRGRVMEVIERELGYRTVKPQHNPKSFSGFLKFDCIRRVDVKLEWRQAVREGAKLLENRNFIDPSYVDNMIAFIEEQGFYAVSDGSFALLHGKGTKGIEKTSLSLLVNRQPVWFGEKQAKVIFCLASRDAKEHIPAVVTLMRMVKATPLIREQEACRTEEEIYQTILNCEFEVL